MPKFRSRPVDFEAVQWKGDMYGTPGVIQEPNPDYRPGGTLPDYKYYVMTAHKQKVYLEIGDWVRAEPDGRGHYPIKPDIFVTICDPI
jgi:hypothetical protein